jgi:hypothetical protein
MQDLDQEKQEAFNCLLEANIQRAQDAKAYYVGNSYVTTGARSAAPLGVAYLRIAGESHQHYWRHGSLSQEPELLEKTKLPNPLFAYHVAKSPTLHYGTDPLLGFHLAAAFAPLAKDPRFGSSQISSLDSAVEAAQTQFRLWCKSFKQSSVKSLIVRFFAGDAIAFARALHHTAVTGDCQSANIYRDLYHAEPIKLDYEEYQSAKKAPLSFTVIDTSNLVDHLGALNLLSATSPLLKDAASSSIYTESLVKREESYQAYVNFLLCGDFSTMSLLLDLFPLEYWTNLSSSSSADDAMFDEAMRLTETGREGQMRVTLTWKRLTPLRNAQTGVVERRLRFDETDLAHILFTVYQNMFQHEDMLWLFANINPLQTTKSSILHYHRGSFVYFLKLVQSRVVVDWHIVMDKTLQLIESDSTIMMGRNYMQELYLHLHLLDLYSVNALSQPKMIEAPVEGGISKWESLPSVVCITIKVPRKSLSALTVRKATELGTPIAHCLVQSSSSSQIGRWQNIFSAVQILFGTVTSTGTRHSNDFAIQITEDELRWNGTSPLVVSFNAPSWFLLLEPRTAIVAFGLQSTPYSSSKFAQSLGLEMKVFETTLGNEENVYVTKYLPSLTGTVAIHGFSTSECKPHELPKNDFKTTITANIIQTDRRIVSLTGRIDLLSDGLKDKLRSGCAIETTQTAPCEIVIAFTGKNGSMLLQFPAPLVRNKGRTRIARKSSYVEVEMPIDVNAWRTFPAFISPR